MSLAPIAAESPEEEKNYFPETKERPAKAPFVSWKIFFLPESLQRKAGLAPEKIISL